jgi:hypothetical protein
MCTNEKEHPFGCSLILLWVKIFKVYSFAGHLKIVCQDIFVWYSTHRQFEQTSKQSTAIHAGKVFTSSLSGKQRFHRSYVVCTHLFACSAEL